MNEQDYLGYVLKALDPQEMQMIEEHLLTYPEEQTRVLRLKQALEPLEPDRDVFDPPRDLAIRTLAHIAEYIVATEGAAPPKSGVIPIEETIRGYQRMQELGGYSTPSTVYPFSVSEAIGEQARRRNVIAGLCLTLALLILTIPALLVVREQQQIQACQNNLRMFHQSLVGYSDLHEGQFPQIRAGQPAGIFVTILGDAGLLPVDLIPNCPSTHLRAEEGAKLPSGTNLTQAMLEYAYTLGYWDEMGKLQGLSRSSDQDNDHLPILADTPHWGRCGGESMPMNHRKGQNVLFVGGHVRFATNTNLGLPGDSNIFCNEKQQNRAGLNRWDIALGRADELP